MGRLHTECGEAPAVVSHTLHAWRLDRIHIVPLLLGNKGFFGAGSVKVLCALQLCVVWMLCDLK